MQARLRIDPRLHNKTVVARRRQKTALPLSLSLSIYYEMSIDINVERSHDPAWTNRANSRSSLGTDARHYETSPTSEQKVYSDQGSHVSIVISTLAIATASKTNRAAVALRLSVSPLRHGSSIVDRNILPLEIKRHRRTLTVIIYSSIPCD